MNIPEFLRSPVLKNICERLILSCYFDTINQKQAGFCTTQSFKTLVSKRKYKNNHKNGKYLNNNNNNSNNNCHVYKCLCNVLPWFYKKFRSGNLSVLNTGPGTRDHLKSSQRRNETSLQLKRLFLHARTGIKLLFFRSKLHLLKCAALKCPKLTSNFLKKS